MCDKQRFSLGARLLLVLMLFAGGQAVAMDESMRMAPGDQKVLNFSAPITKVATSNPEVAKLTVSGSQEVLVTAFKEGSSEITIWQRGESRPMRSSVAVATTLGGNLPYGTQVQTDIRVLEVSRSELNSLGVYYANLFDGGDSAVGIAPPGTGYRGFSGPGAAQNPLSADGFNLFGFGSNSLTIINALEGGGFAYTLAEPSLTSLSGQSASFLSGGEFPVPTRSNDNGIQIEFKEFGVGLSLTPTVISDQQIILKVAPEVSELDFSAGVQVSGTAVPALTVRRTDTTVELGSGESFVISGLISRNMITSVDKVPFLGSIPFLGAFFKSSRYDRDERELIMVVTPHLVEPLKAGAQVPDLPGQEYDNYKPDAFDLIFGETGRFKTGYSR